MGRRTGGLGAGLGFSARRYGCLPVWGWDVLGHRRSAVGERLGVGELTSRGAGVPCGTPNFENEETRGTGLAGVGGSYSSVLE